MFVGTLTGMTLQWFNGIPDGHVTSFSQFSRLFREQFSKLFREQFSTNKVKPPRLYDLFDVRQREGELLKDYLNKFNALIVRLQTHDEQMMIVAFEQGMVARSFSDSLIRSPAEMFFEVHERVVAHIKAKEWKLAFKTT